MPRRDIACPSVGSLVIVIVVLARGAANADQPVPEPVPRFVAKAPPPHRQAGKIVEAEGPSFGAYYSYVSFSQGLGGANVGAGGLATVEEPALAATDFHSLAELAVSSADARQVVEIGWSVDFLVNGDLVPHLFVYHWVNGEPTCYNGCGYVQRSKTRFPGMRVEVTRAAQAFAIRRQPDQNWWLYYQGEAIGYFPDSEWNGSFTSIARAQWFGEVSSATEITCSEMGNGKLGSTQGAAAMSDLYIVDRDGRETPATIDLDTVSDGALYDFGNVTGTGFSYGGPGRASASCCLPSTCESLAAQCGSPVEPSCGGQASCGQCGAGATCTADFQCPGQAPSDPVSPEAGRGCQVGGVTSSTAIPLIVLALVATRRRPALPRSRNASGGR